ncbi:MAG: PGPGW domain-containing protein [Myxococcota bacterium]
MADAPPPRPVPSNGALLAQRLMRAAWRSIVLVVGGTVLAIGVAMVVLPGPAFVVIPAGLAILATEFVWARRLLVRVRAYIENVIETAKKPRQPR